MIPYVSMHLVSACVRQRSLISRLRIQLTVVLQQISVSVSACTTINHLQPLTRTEPCTCDVVGRHVACMVQISRSRVPRRITFKNQHAAIQIPVRGQTECYKTVPNNIIHIWTLGTCDESKRCMLTYCVGTYYNHILSQETVHPAVLIFKKRCKLQVHVSSYRISQRTRHTDCT